MSITMNAILFCSNNMQHVGNHMLMNTNRTYSHSTLLDFIFRVPHSGK